MKMGIKIGNNNNVNESIIGNNNKKDEEKNKLMKIVAELFIAIAGGLIVAFLVYKFGWNK